jgi:ureidoacrylate peracid hydrolase
MKDMGLKPARTALLVIDAQVYFAAPSGVMARLGARLDAVPAALAQAIKLVDGARAAGVMLIFTRVISDPNRNPVIGWRGGADFVAPLPEDGELVITKRLYSAFADTGLAEALEVGGIDTLLLCGLTTECCVQSTAWAAFERNLRVFIAVDACAAYDPPLHAAALKSLELSGAVLGNVADYVGFWN